MFSPPPPLSGHAEHRHVPAGPGQQHHHAAGAARLPHPRLRPPQAVQQPGRAPDPRQRLEAAGPKTQPGPVGGGGGEVQG